MLRAAVRKRADERSAASPATTKRYAAALIRQTIYRAAKAAEVMLMMSIKIARCFRTAARAIRVYTRCDVGKRGSTVRAQRCRRERGAAGAARYAGAVRDARARLEQRVTPAAKKKGSAGAR